MLRAHLTTSSFRRLAAIALGLSALAAPSLALAQDAQAESGFALMTSLGARYGILASVSGAITGGGGADLPGVTPQIGLAAGYKAGRIFIGVGLEFSNGTYNTTNAAGTEPNVITTSTTTSTSNFLIGPDFEYAILRSPDQRVELLADLALHFGHQFQSTTVTITPTPPPVTVASGPTESNFLLSYRLGPGVRFWAHKHFAIQAVTGFGGQAYFDIPIPNVPATGNNSQHGIFANFGAMGVF